MGNQAWIMKLAIGTRIDSNRNNPGTKNGTTKQIYDLASPKGDHKNCNTKAKPYSEGEGLNVLQSQNDGKKILKIWTGGKNFNASTEHTNILCKIQKGEKSS